MDMAFLLYFHCMHVVQGTHNSILILIERNTLLVFSHESWLRG
jgi:hypothetical protein